MLAPSQPPLSERQMHKVAKEKPTQSEAISRREKKEVREIAKVKTRSAVNEVEGFQGMCMCVRVKVSSLYV